MSDYRKEAAERFDDAVLTELAKMLRISPDDANRLQADLIEVCAHFLAVVASLPCDLPAAPFNMSLSRRVEWLEAHVINPCLKLQSAIVDDMQPMFSTWPYPLTIPQFPDHSILASELAALMVRAVALRDDLRGQLEGDAGHSQEVRQEIFCEIARAVGKHAPHTKPSRGVYDAALRRRVGPYVDAMRLIFAKITGVEESLDRLIRGEIGMPS